MKKKRGFTLIELLVVIAVIAVLMAILMPSLQRAKEQARMLGCRNNLRQYGMAFRMYCDENDFEMPHSFTWLYAKNDACAWHERDKNLDEHPELAGSLWPYLKSTDVHLCPAFNVVAKMMGCGNCGSSDIDPQYGYVMNAYLNGDGFGPVPAQYRSKLTACTKETKVKNPSNVVAFSEENSWAIPGLSGCGINDNNLRSTPSCTTDCFGTFHKTSKGDLNSGVCNAVFVDGHAGIVSANPPGNTYVMTWPVGGTPPMNW